MRFLISRNNHSAMVPFAGSEAEKPGISTNGLRHGRLCVILCCYRFHITCTDRMAAHARWCVCQNTAASTAKRWTRSFREFGDLVVLPRSVAVGVANHASLFASEAGIVVFSRLFVSSGFSVSLHPNDTMAEWLLRNRAGRRFESCWCRYAFESQGPQGHLPRLPPTSNPARSACAS